MVVCNLVAQQVPFNAIFLISDPTQKWRLLANFVLYFLPFLAGALFLGMRLPEGAARPSAASTSPTSSARACAACRCCWRCMSSRPTTSIMAPLLLWLAGGLLWFVRARRPARHAGASSPSRCCRPPCTTSRRRLLGIPKLAVSDYKGVAYARKFPDAQAHLRARLAVRLPGGLFQLLPAFRAGPVRQRRLQPARRCRPTPISACISIGDGPSGIMQATCRPSETAYFRYLPMFYPYVLKQDAEHLRRPVRRRHLDRGGAEVGLRARHGRRGQSARC